MGYPSVLAAATSCSSSSSAVSLIAEPFKALMLGRKKGAWQGGGGAPPAIDFFDLRMVNVGIILAKDNNDTNIHL